MLCSVHFRRVPWFVLALTLFACLPIAAATADTLKEQSALKFIPADAAFYVTGLRQREQFDKLVGSQAFAKLSSMPMLQMGIFMARSQWENPQNPQVAAAKMALQDPANQQLVELLKDAVSHEIFMYGEPGFGAAIQLLNELNTASNAGQLEALAAGEPGNAGEYQVRRTLEVMEEKRDQLTIPNSITGFRLSDTEAATTQLQRLEQLLTAVLAEQPQLQQRFSREEVGGNSFLTLRLDGSLVPWQQLPSDNLNATDEQLEKLEELLKDVKLTISLGIRDNYLLLSVGSDNKHLAELGADELLIDREEMGVMGPHAEEPLVGISYTSAAFAQAIGSINQQMDQLTAMAKQFLPMAPISPDLQQELISDIEGFGSHVTDSLPVPGATLGYSFMTAAGYETFAHNWGENKTLDASQPLTILEHLGGSPVAFYAARGKTSSDDYGRLAKLLERTTYYAEQIALEQMTDEQKTAYDVLKPKLLPLVERLGQVTREKLMPAFQDGQGAMVLDGESTSDSWHQALPPAGNALPMLELGIVYGVSDANSVREACSDYFAIAQETLDLLHTASTEDETQALFQEEVPEIQLVTPQTRDVGNGKIYYYTFPAESGLDKQIALNAGLSEDTMVLSFLPLFSKRLLDASPLEGQGPLANLDRPLAAAGYLDFAGLIETLEPWIDYGTQLAMGFGGNAQSGATWVAQLKDALDVVKCFRGVSAVTYQQEDRMVTHLEWNIEDLK